MKRRDFIKNTSIGAILPGMFGQYGIEALALSPWLRSLAASAYETDRVLVIIRLNGGNDGINTVIPIDQYTNLSSARTNLLIRDADVLKLNGLNGTGLHPGMTGLRDLYNEKKVRIIQGVSYPNQNFSHFRSTDIYMSASDANEQVTTGWMGRYLGTEYPNFPVGYPNTTMPDPLAIQINDMTLTLQGPSSLMGITVSNPSAPYDFLDDPNNTLSGNIGEEVNFLRTIAKQADRYGEGVKVAFEKANNRVTYPTANPLADQLKIIARLIQGGLKTRVYMATIGGFDTHSNQVDATNRTTGTHATLLKNLSDAITSFQRDIEAMQLQNRVLGMTFSEFGRRIRSNGSGGTDHGAGYPMFLFGASVNGGMSGVNPEIIANTTVNSNVPMQHDFRSVYASVLKDWFCVNDNDLQSIMLRNFQYMKLLNTPGCIATSTHEQNAAAGVQLISNYPNPFDVSTTIEFETDGDFAIVQVFDAEGMLLAVPAEGFLPEGKHQVTFEGSFLPAGVYYARLQNGSRSQVRTMVKVR
jgi:uncharacterized protein (DUF1501 family)